MKILIKTLVSIFASAFIIIFASKNDAYATETKVPDETVTFCAVGDNLAHSTVYGKCKNPDGAYDFNKIYDHIRETISSYDLAVVNQETVLVSDYEKVSSYPCFGTPDAMADAIKNAGFDIVLQATNHTMDKGISGVNSSLDTWQKYPEISLLGIHKPNTDHYAQLTKNGITFSMFNYTYGTNGIKIPSKYAGMIDTLADKDRLIKNLHDSNSDFNICFLHIGTEYAYTPTEYQKSVINDIIDAGADVVICSHPHVVEPYGYVTTAAGNKGLIYYSCGNFVSGQDKLPCILGGMASMTFRKTANGVCRIESENFTPLVTNRTDGNSGVIDVYLLSDYTDALASKHSISDVTVKKLYELWNNIMVKTE